MNSRRSTHAHVGALLVLIAGLFFVVYDSESAGELPRPTQAASTNTSEDIVATSSVTAPSIVAATTSASSTSVKSTPPVATSSPKKATKASIQATKSAATTSPNDILRVESPYSTPPLSFESINTSARATLVNIFCSTKSSGALLPITGSGIMVDPRGVVLTNAHVAQYVLIAESGKTDLSCELRTGAPAVSKWVPVVEYIPTVWIDLHAPDIIKQHALGTGEHDYALLSIKSTLDGSPLPPSFAYVSPDPREAIAFVDDNVLVASYPVEFVGATSFRETSSPFHQLQQ